MLADGQGILTGIGKHHKFMGETAADGSRISFDSSERQAAPFKNTLIGVIHFLIRSFRPLFCCIETVPILHNELTAAHESETGPDLIPELGLNLVEIDRQIPI